MEQHELLLLGLSKAVIDAHTNDHCDGMCVHRIVIGCDSSTCLLARSSQQCIGARVMHYIRSIVGVDASFIDGNLDRLIDVITAMISIARKSINARQETGNSIHKSEATSVSKDASSSNRTDNEQRL